MEAAENLGTTQEALSEFIDERSSLSPDMAVRIADEYAAAVRFMGIGTPKKIKVFIDKS